MRTLMIPLALMAFSVAVPAAAQNFPDRGNAGRGDSNHDRGQNDRGHNDRGQNDRGRNDARHDNRPDGRDWKRGQRYSYNRPDPRHGGYYADNYYRGGSNYRARALSRNDRIYRGRDNRYYCRRNDGTTGLIIGAVGGGVLGNIIAPGGSKTLGSLLGGGVGAVIGNSIGRGNVTCR